MAYTCSVMMNIAIRANGKKESKLTAPKDFMPDWDTTNPNRNNKEKQSTDEIKKLLLAFASSTNKKNKKPVRQRIPNTKNRK